LKIVKLYAILAICSPVKIQLFFYFDKFEEDSTRSPPADILPIKINRENLSHLSLQDGRLFKKT